MRFEGVVQFVEENVKFGSGHIEDGYGMALAEYHALQGLRKMAQFIGPGSEFAPLSEAEIDSLFDRMDSAVSKMNNQNMRRMMQD